MLVLVGFAAQQVRRGLHPALERNEEVEQTNPEWLRQEGAEFANNGSQRSTGGKRRRSITTEDKSGMRREATKDDDSDAPRAPGGAAASQRP